MSSGFRDKVAQLTAELDAAKKTLASENCTPTIVIIGAVVPIVVFLGLYFGSPGFVMVEEEGKEVRSLKKVFMWLVIITLTVWGGLFGYHMYSGGDLSQTCVR